MWGFGSESVRELNSEPVTLNRVKRIVVGIRFSTVLSTICLNTFKKDPYCRLKLWFGLGTGLRMCDEKG